MSDNGRVSSHLKGAHVFLGVATGGAFASCIYYSFFAELNPPPVVIAATFLTWLALSFYGSRGYSFARWGLALGLAGAATIPSLLLLGTVLALSTGVGSFADNYLLSALVILLWTGAVGLVFSESVGDYFSRSRDGSPLRWDETPLTPRQEWNVSSGGRVRVDGDIVLRAAFARRVRSGVLCAFVSIAVLAATGAGVTIWKFRHQVANQPMPFKGGNPVENATLILGAALTAVTVVFGCSVAVVGIYLLFFVLPFVITLPVTLPFAKRWRDPGRFLLLRPFGSPRISRDLRSLLQQELSPLGHCYTLADAAIHISWQVRIPFLLGQLALFSFRTRKIRNPRNLERLVREMNKRVMRNLNWVLSRDPLFPITCADAAWQACVRATVERSDVIFMDVSAVTENMLWELDVLRKSGAFVRTILLVHENSRAEAMRKLEAISEPVLGVRVVDYGGDAIAGVLSKSAGEILHRKGGVFAQNH